MCLFPTRHRGRAARPRSQESHIHLPMRALSRSPAQQLRGIAARYRSRLVAARWHERSDRGLPEGRLPSGGTVEGDGSLARSPSMVRLEAVLFLAKQPLASRKLSQLAGLADGTEARTLLRGLNRFYDEARSAFRVEEFGGGFQLLTRPKFAPWLRRLHRSPLEMRLSAPALETLAVVAYRQPVLRVEVESIRGVQCGEILRQLMQRDLVRIVGRSDEPRRRTTVHRRGQPLRHGISGLEVGADRHRALSPPDLGAQLASVSTSHESWPARGQPPRSRTTIFPSRDRDFPKSWTR